MPIVDAATYRILITGEVQRTVVLSLDELRALSPARTVTATLECAELSIDRGETWMTTDIVERADPYAWCFWEVRSNLSPGDCALVVRAWDESGRTSPRDARSIWNFKGYMNNAWQRVEIRVSERAVARREQPFL